jgi:hypothetical protein
MEVFHILSTVHPLGLFDGIIRDPAGMATRPHNSQGL